MLIFPLNCDIIGAVRSYGGQKTLNDTIISYRVIYRELLGTAQRLRERAGEQSHAA